MPSIQDVADQINARLDQVATNTGQTAQNTADNLAVSQDIRTELNETNARLGIVDNTLQVGFANVSQGLFALLQVQLAALNLLDHHRRQNDTIICNLEHANELLCDIKRRLGTGVELSAAIKAAVERAEGIDERVHAAEAADYDRDLRLSQEIEQCCPPTPEPPEPCPEPCQVPGFRDRTPEGQDWQPLPTPQRPDPIG